MMTTPSTRSPASRASAATSPTISPAERLRTRPPMVEAQKAHPIAHPTCEETQTVVPCSYFIKTASTELPSDSSSRYFAVPSSAETCFCAIFGVTSG